MTDEQIVEVAKKAEQKTEFGELVYSQVSRGVNSAYGIGFLEGAEWAREQMMKESVEMYPCYDEEHNLVGFSTDYEANGAYGQLIRIIIVKED